MITVGLTLIGHGIWSGGETYLRNMLSVMGDELHGKVTAKLFLTPAQAEKVGTSFDAFLAEPAIVDARVAGAGQGRRALAALATGADRAFADLVTAHGINVMFEPAQWFGNRFPVPVLSWIPDFQHRRLPHLFPRAAWWRREIGYRVQTGGRRALMLSSMDALADCEHFYPAARGKTTVVRFSIDLDPQVHLARAVEIRQIYDLPDRFFYLPNQFWSHKNHAVIVAALRLLSKESGLAGFPPVVMSGRTRDDRDPTLFDRLVDEAAKAGVSGHFRHLGLVPLADVFSLNAASLALINPSRFEGWSTTVEEAKALGTPMILSDIPVHREQAPDAAFFAPDEAAALAKTLRALAVASPQPRATLDALRAAQARRRLDHGTALLSSFAKAIDMWEGRDP